MDPDLETVGRVLEGSKLYVISALFVLASSCSPILAKATPPCTPYSALLGATHSMPTTGSSISCPILANVNSDSMQAPATPCARGAEAICQSQGCRSLRHACMHACILLLECSHTAATQSIIRCSSASRSLLPKYNLPPAGSNASLENALHTSFPAPVAGWRPAVGLSGRGASHCRPGKGHCPDCSQQRPPGAVHAHDACQAQLAGVLRVPQASKA